MELHLAGKTALVTGASRGIGLAVTRTLIVEGVRVVGVARRPTPELEGTGALVVEGDLSRPETAADVVRQALAETGSLDLLVNNAGGGEDLSLAGFADLDDEAWSHALDLNLLAAVRLTRAALPELVRSRGVVVNVSSLGARKPEGPPLAYNVAKAALTAFGRGLAFELGPQGVRVVTVTPGPTRTAMWDQMAAVTGAPVEAILAGVPQQLGMVTGRMNKPDDVAALIAFLLSPLAANVPGRTTSSTAVRFERYDPQTAAGPSHHTWDGPASTFPGGQVRRFGVRSRVPWTIRTSHTASFTTAAGTVPSI